ncbi:hypothetical protein niasHT_020584 [Heterodera trifolii]|uniref:Uncharacterized protein n=1 Tax=Heterodera trifolii TaxID=157864 RepID=A0ABD2JND2_9BILA
MRRRSVGRERTNGRAQSLRFDPSVRPIGASDRRLPPTSKASLSLCVQLPPPSICPFSPIFFPLKIFFSSFIASKERNIRKAQKDSPMDGHSFGAIGDTPSENAHTFEG